MELLTALSLVAKWIFIIITLWGVFCATTWFIRDRMSRLSDFLEDYFIPFYNSAELFWVLPVVMLVFIFAAFSELPPTMQKSIVHWVETLL